jgi:hypothetical protein
MENEEQASMFCDVLEGERIVGYRLYFFERREVRTQKEHPHHPHPYTGLCPPFWERCDAFDGIVARQKELDRLNEARRRESHDIIDA